MAVLSGYGSMALQVVVQILLVPLYLDALGNYRFGVLMILSAQIAFAYLFVGLFYSVLLRLFRESLARSDPEEFSRIYIAGKLVLIGVGLLFGATVLGAETFHPVFFEDAPAQFRSEIWVATALATAHYLLLCEISVEQTIFSAIQKQASANIVTLVSQIVFAVTVILWLSHGGGLVGVMVCFLLGDLASRLAAFVVMRRAGLRIDFWRGTRRLREVLRRLLSSRARLHFYYALLAMILQSDVLIMGWLVGPDMTAQFVLVWKITEMLILVISRMVNHLQPEFVAMDISRDSARLERVYREAYAWLFAVSAAFAVIYAVLGFRLVGLWVGSDRAPADMWLYWLAAAAVFWIGISRLPAIFAQALSRMRFLLWLAAIELAGKLLLIVVLLPRFGIAAPLIAITVVHALGAAYAYWWLGRSLARSAGSAVASSSD